MIVPVNRRIAIRRRNRLRHQNRSRVCSGGADGFVCLARLRACFAIAAILTATRALAQPGQPAPALPSLTMQDSNLRPALPRALQGVGIDQSLDQQVPLNLVFRDEADRQVPLATYFQPAKPVLLALVYYRCPML